MHPTGGSRRVFNQFAWLGVGSAKAALSRPTHQRVQFSLTGLLLIFSFLLGACGSSQTAPESETVSRSPSDKISTPATSLPTVTGQADGAPAGCSVQEFAQQLQNFAAAFNEGDQQQLSTLFSNRAPFAWYAAPEGASTMRSIYVVGELAQYFEQRHAQHEYLEFQQIQVNEKPLLPSSLVMDKEKRMRTGKFRSEINAPNTACTRLVGVAAFSGNFHGLRLVPSKRRYLVPPTSG